MDFTHEAEMKGQLAYDEFIILGECALKKTLGPHCPECDIPMIPADDPEDGTRWGCIRCGELV